MNPEDLIKLIRTEMIENLSNDYASMFSADESNKFTDSEMKSMHELWQSCNEESRVLLTKFIRLGAQNGISSLLGHIDNISSTCDQEIQLQLTDQDGNVLSGDLLDIFWGQEEDSGNVNSAI